MARSTLIPLLFLAPLAGAFLLVTPAAAQQEGGEGPPPCTAEIDRAFDFWAGDWEVRNPDGEVVGHNTIRKMAGRCGLAENWRGAGGSVGESLNFYDPSDGLWHQLWIDGGGLILRLEGGPHETGMRMVGRASDRRAALHRITWSPLADGRVRQLWELSPDGGEAWRVIFDGYYSPVQDDSAAGSM